MQGAVLNGAMEQKTKQENLVRLQVSCGFLAFWQCSPLSCSAANPNQCTAVTSCGSGGTLVGSKCLTFNSTPQTWLAAMTTCLAAGETTLD